MRKSKISLKTSLILFTLYALLQEAQMLDFLLHKSIFSMKSLDYLGKMLLKISFACWLSAIMKPHKFYQLFSIQNHHSQISYHRLKNHGSLNSTTLQYLKTIGTKQIYLNLFSGRWVWLASKLCMTKLTLYQKNN